MSGKAFENEYIGRRDAIKARKRSCNKNCLECDFAIEGDSWCEGEVFVVDLLRIPPADVRPVVHGKWIFDCERKMHDGWTYRQYHCSACEFQMIGGNHNFCPNCGADMREMNT